MQAGREIKFQAWVPDIGQMVQVAEIDLVNGVVSWYTSEAEIMARIPDADAFLDRVKLRQFTGLRDKNGKEIYEGDILTSESYPFQDDGKYNYHGIVEWSDGYAAYFLTKHLANGDKRGISHGISETLMDYDMTTFEVIGNIYEHPELLQAG
jgi:uncharacterized phage protein (TIGR01671 family)